MRLSCLALVALVATGCATSRPSPAPPPVTLAEVNRTLGTRTATVYFAGDRAPTRGEVVVGPEVTTIRNLKGVETLATAEIASVTLDMSMSATTGALHGAGIGVAPGAGLALAVALDGDDGSFSGKGFDRLVLRQAAIWAAVGAAVGAGLGAASAAPRDERPVYEAPITRYPDAGLVLLQRDGPAPTASR